MVVIPTTGFSKDCVSPHSNQTEGYAHPSLVTRATSSAEVSETDVTVAGVNTSPEANVVYADKKTPTKIIALYLIMGIK